MSNSFSSFAMLVLAAIPFLAFGFAAASEALHLVRNLGELEGWLIVPADGMFVPQVVPTLEGLVCTSAWVIHLNSCAMVDSDEDAEVLEGV